VIRAGLVIQVLQESNNSLSSDVLLDKFLDVQVTLVISTASITTILSRVLSGRSVELENGKS